MKNSRLPILFFLLLTVPYWLSTAVGQTKDLTHWVNPFIGTGGHGHTFPGATMPFGMVQLSPDTRTDNWDGSSGYHYSDDIIYGFSHTHLSGTGIPDYCDILFMPSMVQQGSTKKFSHADESASPGFYSVKMSDGISVELTSSSRVGLQRYSFPRSGDAYVFLDLAWRDKKLDAKADLVGDRRVEGFRRSSSWAKDQTVYFVAEFSQPVNGSMGSSTSHGGYYGGSYHFDLKKGAKLLVKVAISSVSIEGARKNLAAELPGWDFDRVRADAKAAWNKELSKIEVSGGTDAQTTTFYTALYHTMIQPNIFNDVDGQYKGLDGKIHQLPGYAASPTSKIAPSGSAAGSDGWQSRKNNSLAPRKSTAFPHIDGQSPKNSRSAIGDPQSEQYTVFSLWDTFRAAHPLYTIIEQKRTVDFINTFIRQYEQSGRLPVWELAGNETDTMIGYHAVSVIADAMAKGIKGCDYEKAYEAAKHSAELDRDGLAAYKRRGYISMEDENESVSKTLEYAYDDWCIAQMAKVLLLKQSTPSNFAPKPRIDPSGIASFPIDTEKENYRKDYVYYLKRARSFENLFDPGTGFMRPKKNGGFVTPFAPNEVTFNYTEGNAWVYSFFVPQDISRLMELHGGRDKFAAKLDELFTTKDKLAGREQPDITGLIGQYAHGNEPSHHIAYLYDYAGQPWKTQKLVRQIMDEFYKPEPDGLIGNEDCGQMSAWYVLSASGFYPVTPGGGIYVFGTPLFPEVKYHLENRKIFTIRANNVSTTNKYIRSVKLNGAVLDAPILPHEDIMKGGVLEFDMTDKPEIKAFTSTSGPVSTLPGNAVPVPLISGGGQVFDERITVSLSTLNADSKIHFTTDGSTPTIKSPTYGGPITISSTTTVKAITEDFLSRSSLVAEGSFLKKPNNWTVKIDSKYNRQYTGGGDEGLIDGIRGTTSFASGEWQGYQGQDFVATVDLQKETEIKKVSGGFLQNAGSWIWMPTHIEFETSVDGINFTKVADIKTDIAATDMESKVRDYTKSIAPVKARYVRVHAYNLGKIPSWHPGAGDDAFIFVDEIIIR
ncbi:MAG: GH92 family glycosyl hydrolase [Pyrinomonadaceae bacterium]